MSGRAEVENLSKEECHRVGKRDGTLAEMAKEPRRGLLMAQSRRRTRRRVRATFGGQAVRAARLAFGPATSSAFYSIDVLRTF